MTGFHLWEEMAPQAAKFFLPNISEHLTEREKHQPRFRSLVSAPISSLGLFREFPVTLT